MSGSGLKVAYYVANIRAGAFKGNPVARDSQTALIAIIRFGFGARGGAAGDLVNAASDPRGFVKAELSRPNAALLEVPGLQSTPALAEAAFAYQARLKQAREMAANAPSNTRRCCSFSTTSSRWARSRAPAKIASEA